MLLLFFQLTDFLRIQVYVKQSSWSADVPVIVILRALGVQSDEQIFSLFQHDPYLIEALFDSMDEAETLGVTSQEGALEYILQLMRSVPGQAQPQGVARREDVLDMLSNALISHVPVQQGGFSRKIMYIVCVVRRILLAVKDPSQFDDKVRPDSVMWLSLII
jgi:DNA-directed RNA polymerase III subunit RPC2